MGGIGGASAGGGAGGLGGGGAGGHGGGGAGGATSTGAVCGTADVTFGVYAADASFIIAPISDSVTVRSVDHCVGSDCSTQTLRIVLARSVSSDTLTLYLHIPGMPDAYFGAGDVFDLALTASVDMNAGSTVNQALTLSRDSKVMVLGVNMASFLGPPLPASLGDLTLTDAGISCVTPELECGKEGHAVKVTRGSSSATVPSGGTALIGTLSFTSGHYERLISHGGCDAKSPTLMAAFDTNVCHGSTPAVCTSGPSSCCGDTEEYAVCQGGAWVCPSGMVSISSCTGYGMGQTGTCAGGL